MVLNSGETLEVFRSRCLLCTCRPDVTPHLHIFSDVGKQLQLADNILNYLDIQIEAELPQNVCHSCMEKLEVTHELVTKSRRARIMLLQIKQQSENVARETNQESSDPTLELDSSQAATDSDSEKENEADNTSCSAEDFDQSDTDSDVQMIEEPNHISPCSPSQISSSESTEDETDSDEGVLTSQIKIESSNIPEAEEEQMETENEDLTESKKQPAREVRVLRNRQISYKSKNAATRSKQNGHQRKNTAEKNGVKQNKHLKTNTAQKNGAKQNGRRRKNGVKQKGYLKTNTAKKNGAKQNGLRRKNGVKQKGHLKTNTAKKNGIKQNVHREKNTAQKNSMKCKICNVGFKSAKLRKEHVTNVHGTKRGYKCDRCDFISLVSYKQVSLHCTESHPALPCEFCTAKFNCHRNLNRHVRRIHTAPVLQCDLCQHTTHRKDRLVLHLQTVHHSLFKETFTCEFCDATFNCKAHLRSHVKGKHTGKILYCEHCTYSSPWKCSLVRHIKLKHFKPEIEEMKLQLHMSELLNIFPPRNPFCN